MIKKALYYVIGAALVLAILRIFNNDPLGLVDWIIDTLWSIVVAIRDFFVSQPWFHRLFGK